MAPATLALVLASVTLSACAQLLLKIGVSASRTQPADGSPAAPFPIETLFHPGVVGGILLYGLGMMLWLLVLARTELSQAYPFVGLGFVMTALFGALILHEPFGVARVLGTALILAGVVLVAQS